MGASQQDKISDLIEQLATERSAEKIEEATATGYYQAASDIIAALAPLFKAARLEVTVRRIEYAELEEIPVEDLNFTVRAYNCLKREGIHNLLQLSEKTFTELLGFRNLGYTSVVQIQDKLSEYGLSIPGFVENYTGP